MNSRATGPAPADTKKHLLVVDDESQLLLALRINLSARGYDVAVASDPVVPVGHHLVDLAAHSVTRAPDAPRDVPETVRLTRTEWAVLETLLRNPGRLVSSKQLLAQVWGTENEPEGSYLRFYLSR